MADVHQHNTPLLESSRNDTVKNHPHSQSQEGPTASPDGPVAAKRTFIDVPRPTRIDSHGRLLAHADKNSKGSRVPVSKTGCIRTTHRPTRPKLRDAAAQSTVGAYIVVGIVDPDTGATVECLQSLANADGRPKDLIESIHKAVRRLRPWYIRWFTLKSVGAFGLYECHPPAGQHTVLELSDTAKLALLELYYDFVARRRDNDEAWKSWVQKHFNAGDTFPGDLRLGLRLILTWSISKIVFFVAVPVVVSFVFGLAYTFAVSGPGVDHVAVVQTAWTVSSYIVTTAGAVLAAITSLRDY
ncbi:hypothetical protein F5Y14DRAFT_149006 [Nemania sp. NC0429]|nr:hypothetical protein F5Y14DRAFT_149006 [Nemania sp. NC0429]